MKQITNLYKPGREGGWDSKTDETRTSPTQQCYLN